MSDETEFEAPPEGAADDPSPAERIAALEQELADTKDRLLRALAELENVRRRAEREREDARKYAAQNFAKELVNVADNLRRAIDSEGAIAADPSARGVIDGVAATERELLAIFERHGVKRVEPQIGERFDPNLHQAMFEIAETGLPAGSVAQLLQPGYVMHDRLLRPAMVGVAKGGAGPTDVTVPQDGG
ncbi:MAG TPA: nucleotide exchange factor GrpE [Stellaceae bacterium]|nr:nucleotide exchange factor GrpE [Stellaceae bacterium]